LDFSRRRVLTEIAIGSAWLVGIAAAVRIADLVLDKNPLAAAIAGAIVVDFAAARAGVTWDGRPEASGGRSPDKAASARGSPAGAGAAVVVRWIGAGMAIGVLIVVVTVALGLAFGGASVSIGMPSPVLGFALIQSAAIAVRDELLYRGVVLITAERAGLSREVAAGYAALAGAAAIALLPESSPGAVVLALASGWLFARIWQRGHGAWEAVGAHAAWAFCAGPLLRGGLVDVTWAHGLLSPGPRAEGTAAYLASAICVAMVLGQARVRGVIARVRPARPEPR
jgi:hypothetical protein